MSVTAKFLADFSDFQSAVAKADVSLKSFEGDANRVQTALNKMGDSFSGRKIIQDAELATKAINDIGGATKLTENEQARLNAQLTEALAKYKALGLEAPADMKKLAAETAGANNSAKGMLSTLGNVASAVGIGFSIGAVVSFGKSVLDSASQIGDLATQLGVSTDAVQGFQFAAEQSGSSLETVGTALTKMNSNLAGGSDSTVAALKSAGLAFDDIRAMAPEDAFLAITDAIQKIPDPMVQTRVALELFGKSAAELLPAIKEGFRGVSDSASKMSEDTIKSLKDAQDAWNALGTRVTIITGTMIADALKFLNVWKRMHDDIDRTTPKAPGPIPPDTSDPRSFSTGQISLIHETADALEGYGRALDAQRDKLDRFAIDAKKAAEAMRLKGIADAAEAALDDWAETIKRHQQEQRQGEAETMAALEAIDRDRFDEAKADLDDWAETVRRHQQEQRDGEAATLEALKKNAKASKDALGDLAQALAQLAQISGSAFGGVVSSLSTLIGAAVAAQKAIALMRKSGEEKGSLAGILDMASGITGIVSAAIAAGKAVASLFGLFDRNKGRDLVVAFAETFGGFDALHEKLLMLGDEGEQLWIKLTQGVGRNNPQEAQAAIDAITKALGKQADKSDEAKGATEEQAQATIEAATEAAKALEELGGKLDLNKEQWKDWGTVVTAQLQALADTIRSLPLPTPSGALPFSAGSNGSTKIQVVAPVYLDGNVLTESVAYHTLN